MAAQPEVERAEAVIVGFSIWVPKGTPEKPATPEVCTIVGSRLDPESLGAVEACGSSPTSL